MLKIAADLTADVEIELAFARVAVPGSVKLHRVRQVLLLAIAGPAHLYKDNKGAVGS